MFNLKNGGLMLEVFVSNPEVKSSTVESAAPRYSGK
jgi:hypothetical protein